MNFYNPHRLPPMFNDQLLDSNDFLASYLLKTILIGGPSPPDSQSISQNNSLRNPPASSPPVVDHDSTITIDLKKINMLEKNLRDFEGFLN